MSKGQRKRYNSQEKMTILRKHLLEGVPVSDVCEEYGIQPSQFYRWQKTLFEQGSQVFERGQGSQSKQQQRQIEALEKKLSKKDEVLAELMEEYVTLKKSSGEA
jgi:transposase-like protein